MKDRNEPRDQDRAEDLIDNWRKYGYVMFPQQWRIYRQLAERLRHRIVLEAGCGNGMGSAILERAACILSPTDKSPRNVEFARCLYPWIDFRVWDICQPWGLDKAHTVVAVEVLEHVADPQAALGCLIGAAQHEVWISTPNGTGKPRPPENPFHVCEYTPAEMLGMLERAGGHDVEILGWEDFRPVGPDPAIDPLVYHVRLA